MSASLLANPPPDLRLTDELVAHLFTPRRLPFRLTVAACAALTALFFGLVGLTVAEGIGLWGNNIPVAWAFGIVNFVFWIGLGHAGTLISAILLLLEQRWRTSINRFAEGMTLFAVVQAAIFPLVHLGRPWRSYWLLPYPATFGVWPNFKSALPWDVVAVAVYFLVSLLFFYVGLIPDLAVARDRVPGVLRRKLYGLFALGWRGSARHRAYHHAAYILLAGLATPLVVSVHSIVASDFATTLLPGWHSTLFPAYFVAGAFFSGVAMVIALLVPARRVFRLERVVTARHFDNLAKLALVGSWLVTYAYGCELFLAWWSGEAAERYTLLSAYTRGVGALPFWAAVGCNIVLPQLFWWRRARTSPLFAWAVAVLIVAGMWLERYFLVVVALERDFLPAAWAEFRPTGVDLGLLAGSFGFFFLLFLLFLRFIPFVPIGEVKELARELRAGQSRPEGAP